MPAGTKLKLKRNLGAPQVVGMVWDSVVTVAVTVWGWRLTDHHQTTPTVGGHQGGTSNSEIPLSSQRPGLDNRPILGLL